jgi:sigma-B regulation protein RsbU (phosphoserine phosphatase)
MAESPRPATAAPAAAGGERRSETGGTAEAGEAAETAAFGACGGPVETLSCLLESIQALHTAADLEGGLRGFARRLREGIAFDNLGVLLLDDAGAELRFVLAEGYPPEVAARWRFGIGQGLVGTVAGSGEAVLVDDVRDDPRYIDAVPATRSELAVPLISQGRTIGVLDLGSERPGFFTAAQLALLRVVGGQLAGALANARLTESLRAQTQTLAVLHEASRQLAAILEREPLLAKVAELAKRLIDYDVFAVLLWNAREHRLEPSLTVAHAPGAVFERCALALGEGVAGTAAALRQPVRVPNVYRDPRYVRCVAGVEVRSELAVPLLFEGDLLGVVTLDSGRYDAFTTQHEQLLATLGSTIAIGLANARLYERVREQEEILKTDLATAREIQKQLLPTASPWVKGLQVAVAYEPARQLGGDFYDFLPYGDGRAAFAVGDVAGKATAAALYGSLAVGMLRELAARHRAGPARILAAMNARLRQLGIANRFLAMAYAVFDGERRSLTLANSGLPHPYLVRGGRVEAIPVAGVPLGLLPDRDYPEVELALGAGDTVVLASDGIEEALDGGDREFGRERVEASLARLAGGSPRELAEGVVAAADRHAGDGEPHDDRTVMVLRLASG